MGWFVLALDRLVKADSQAGGIGVGGTGLDGVVRVPASRWHARLVARCEPLERLLGQLVKEPALEVVARLAVQHARLRVAQVEAFARARECHVHQAALLFQTIGVGERVFVREQPLFQPGNEHAIKLQTLGRVHRHELDCVLPGLRHVVARLQRGVRQKSGQGRQGLAGLQVGAQRCLLRVGLECVGVAAKAFLHDKALGGVDQFFQILDPVRAFALGAVVRQQAAVLEHALHDVAQVHACALLAQHVNLGHKPGNGRARAPPHGAYAIVQRAARGARHVLQLLDAARTDAARREVDHAQKAGVVVGVLQQAQIGQRVLDFSALEKAQAPIDAVRHSGVEQRRFNHPALRVAAVQDGDFLALDIVAHQLPDFIDHPLRLGKVAGGFVHAHRLARPLIGTQVFAQAAAVVADERVGAVQDVAVAAVVLLQLDLVLHLELAHKVGHVAHTRTAKGVDALVIVAHGQHRTTGWCTVALPLPGQHLDPRVLQPVGVLKLVDQNVAKAPLVVRADGVVVAQQLVRAQNKFTKIDHAFALTLLFVELVQIGLAARVGIAHLDPIGAQAFFLATGNKPLQLLGRKVLVVHVELFAQALDGAELVLRVENLETLRQVGQLEMCPQKAVAQAVKRANPHAMHVDGQHGREARHHLLGGLVGKGHGQHPGRRDLAGLQQPGNARGQHPGLARTGPGQNQRVLGWQRDGGALLGIERVQEGGFKAAVGGRRRKHAPL